MLDKSVCQNCYRQADKDWSEKDWQNGLIGCVHVYIKIKIKQQFSMCFGSYCDIAMACEQCVVKDDCERGTKKLVLKVTEESPIECPYRLEHIMATQQDLNEAEPVLSEAK